jgi:peptide/nickel transport system substrate-binding protein
MQLELKTDVSGVLPMTIQRARLSFAFWLVLQIFCNGAFAQNPGTSTEFMVTNGEVGRAGGHLSAALTAEPKTLNPVTLEDDASKLVTGVMMADLIHINRYSQMPEAALAKSWSVSRDGRQYTVKLRSGLNFSDGSPLTADDVLFSFNIYLDESVHAPQRDLLIVGGKPITVKKLDAQTIEFGLNQPYGPGVRLFDSFAILPRHLLEEPYKKGTLSQAWNLATPPTEIAGAGPFRLKQYVPGQRIIMERNPFYWKLDKQNNRLPYLDQVFFVLIPNEDSASLRFESGEIDLISQLSAQTFASLVKQTKSEKVKLIDAGSSLQWTFLFFNLNDTRNKYPEIARKQKWFSSLGFRQAVSEAVDRDAIVRLVYKGLASPIWSPITPGNKVWQDTQLPRPGRSLENARQLLKNSGFSWTADGTLFDNEHQQVEFSIVGSSSNTERMNIATLIQEDLRQLGIHVTIVPLEFRALLNRVLDTHEYEACILGLGSGDIDPNADSNVWLSNGATHLWNLQESKPATRWEAEIDELLRAQLTERTLRERKRSFDRVQELLAQNVPFVFLVSPHVLAGAKNGLGNFQPAIMDPAALWNIDELYWKNK